MKDKILFTVTDENIINDLKENGIANFVYPLSFFCVGVKKTFKIQEMKEDNAYIFVNRIMDSKTISALKDTLKDLPSNIKGIIFDDLGIIEILKDLKITKILYNTHFSSNYESINYMFKYVDEIIVSTDITEEEIDEIINKTNKKISLFTFGLVPSLYSRRSLIKNYDLHYNLPIENQKEFNINDKKFIGIENEFGTMMYHYPYYNGLRLLQKDAKYFFYFPIFLESKQILELTQGNLENIETDDGFLDTKTIYKVKGDK